MADSCLNALTKVQIIQELQELSAEFSTKSSKKELVEILKKCGGY